MGKSVISTLRPPAFYDNILALDVAQIAESLTWGLGLTRASGIRSAPSLEECLHEDDNLSLRWIFPDTGWPIGGLDEYPADDSSAVNQEEARELIPLALHVIAIGLAWLK